MATYKPKKKTDNNGTLEDVKFPIESVDGLGDILDTIPSESPIIDLGTITENPESLTNSVLNANTTSGLYTFEYGGTNYIMACYQSGPNGGHQNITYYSSFTQYNITRNWDVHGFYSVTKKEVAYSDNIPTTPSDVGAAPSASGTYFVNGTQTASTNAWTGTLTGIDLYDGLAIRYYLPYAGTSTGATLALNGGTAYPVYRLGATAQITTQFGAGSVIAMTFRTSYNVTGTTKTNAWICEAFYDSNTNTQIRLYRQDSSTYNKDYPLIASRTVASSVGTAGTESSYTAVYGLISDTNDNIPTTNPYTGETKFKTATATTFKENGVSLADKYALKDEVGGNPFENCYLETSVDDVLYIQNADSVNVDQTLVIRDLDTDEALSTTAFYTQIPLRPGDGIEFVKAQNSPSISINATGGSGSGISGTPLVETTYDELKALRDGGQLVAGQKYRITDYNCTTTQENTQSAGHAFDIIVEALSNNTLSENASAIQHGGSGDSGGGSPQFKPEVLADSDGTLVEGAIVSSYYFFEDFEEQNGEQEGYKSSDEFIAYTYLENNDGVVVPVIYKTDANGAIDAPEEFGFPDTEDIFFYDGTMEVDGTTYDKWRKIELSSGNLTWDGDAKVWALTNVVVTGGGSVSDTYFANSKLSAWEIKYSLDNDKTRFWWAMNATPAWFTSNFDVGTWYATGETYEHDGATYYVFFNEGVSTLYSTTPYPTKPNEIYIDFDGSGTLEDDNSVINEYGGSEEGKGVIYYMKDEYGNECPYDFKSIQFKRWATDDEIADDDKFYSSWNDTGNTFRWCYTFMANGYTNDTWADASTIKPYRYMSDEGGMPCGNNTIKPFIQMWDVDEETNAKDGVKWLNNIVLYGSYEDNPIFSDGYEYNYIKCPCGNKFEINNHEMTLGKAYACKYNTFGNGCEHNTFGNNCNGNTFGNQCSSNTFGSGCEHNTFGNNCNGNTFGNQCSSNTFGSGCSSNTFGDNCDSNTFGDNCDSNIFGNQCVSNIVDNYVNAAAPQPTTGTKQMRGVHIHYGVRGQFTVVRGANYTQDVRTANDVTITV